MITHSRAFTSNLKEFRSCLLLESSDQGLNLSLIKALVNAVLHEQVGNARGSILELGSSLVGQLSDGDAGVSPLLQNFLILLTLQLTLILGSLLARSAFMVKKMQSYTPVQ